MVVRFVIFIPVKKRAGGQKKTYWDLFGTSGTYLPYDIYIYIIYTIEPLCKSEAINMSVSACQSGS